MDSGFPFGLKEGTGKTCAELLGRAPGALLRLRGIHHPGLVHLARASGRGSGAGALGRPSDFGSRSQKQTHPVESMSWDQVGRRGCRFGCGSSSWRQLGGSLNPGIRGGGGHPVAGKLAAKPHPGWFRKGGSEIWLDHHLARFEHAVE